MVDFEEKLKELSVSGNLRSLPDVRHDGKYIISGESRMLNLSSNDYLGLASDPDCRLMADFLEEAAQAGLSSETLLSSVSSRLLTGTYNVHSRLEEKLCELSGKEAALVLSSGYHMNIGILPAVADAGTLILADKLVHASIIDGIRLSQAKSVRYRHQDLERLDALVSRYSLEYSRIIIVTESIFSMDGDVSDLKALADIKRRHPGVMLYVDEAHAVGARGETGMGVAQEQGVINDIDFLCGTFGKALASVGAYVLCSRTMRQYLVNRMRSLIFTTALPPLNMLWTLCVLENLEAMSDRRERLAANAAAVRASLEAAGLECPSQSHIIPVMAGESERALDMAGEMQRKGFYLLPVRPPTVPEGTSRLRVSLNAAISDSETKALARELASSLNVF